MREEIEGYSLDVDWPEPMVGMPESEFNKYKAVVEAAKDYVETWADCPFCRAYLALTMMQGRAAEHDPDCPLKPFEQEAKS
jgi:hypothetical protein